MARAATAETMTRVRCLVLLGVLVLDTHGLSLPSRPLGTKATRTQQRVIVTTPDEGAVAGTASTAEARSDSSGNSSDSSNSSSSNDTSGSAAAANGGLGPRVARTIRAARAGAWIGLRGFAPLVVGHAALQLVMHAGLHAVHGLLPPQAYLQFISSFSKSMHWVALRSSLAATVIPCISFTYARWRDSHELRRFCKEAEEVQRIPPAERDAHGVAELKLRYDAFMQKNRVLNDPAPRAGAWLAFTSCSVFGNPGLLRRWGQTRWWGELSACVNAPLVEELLFRGMLLNALHALFGARCARIWSSVLFGMVHLGNHEVLLEAGADMASHPRLLSAFVLVSSPTALLKRGGARRAWHSWAILARGPASTAPTSLTHHRLVTSGWVWAASHVAFCSASAFWTDAPAYRDHGYIGAVCAHAATNAAASWFFKIRRTFKFLPRPRTVDEITEADWLRHWLYTWQGHVFTLTRPRPSLLKDYLRITMNKYFAIVSKLRKAPSRS